MHGYKLLVLRVPRKGKLFPNDLLYILFYSYLICKYEKEENLTSRIPYVAHIYAPLSYNLILPPSV
jgi:hypothetical protein